MCLAQGAKGSSYIVKSIELNDAAKRRLEVLGLVNGTIVQILTRKHNSAMVIKVRGTRFAIGKEFATGINVEYLSERGEHIK